MSYTDGFKARMVQRMAGPKGITATALSREVGVTQPTLSRWLREAHTVAPMRGHNEQQSWAKSPRQWRAEEKLQVVLEASTLTVSSCLDLRGARGPIYAVRDKTGGVVPPRQPACASLFPPRSASSRAFRSG